jgi:hypothetical protein
MKDGRFEENEIPQDPAEDGPMIRELRKLLRGDLSWGELIPVEEGFALGWKAALDYVERATQGQEQGHCYNCSSTSWQPMCCKCLGPFKLGPAHVAAQADALAALRELSAAFKEVFKDSVGLGKRLKEALAEARRVIAATGEKG